jgi:hypothetical protein
MFQQGSYANDRKLQTEHTAVTVTKTTLGIMRSAISSEGIDSRTFAKLHASKLNERGKNLQYVLARKHG